MESRKSLIFGEPTICDFSNTRIKRTEPRFVLYHLPIINTKRGVSQETKDFHVKISALDDLLEETKKQIPIDQDFEGDYVGCPHPKKEYVINTEDYEGAQKKDLWICKECQKSLLEIIKNIKKKAEEDVRYWSTSGLYVRVPERDRECKLREDIIEGPALVIGSEFGQKSSYSLKKIVDLKEKLKEIEIHENIEESECLICTGKIGYKDRVASLDYVNSERKLHPKCLEEMKKEIDKIIEEEKSFIMAREI